MTSSACQHRPSTRSAIPVFRNTPPFSEIKPSKDPGAGMKKELDLIMLFIQYFQAMIDEAQP